MVSRETGLTLYAQEAGRFGNVLEIRTTPYLLSKFRMMFDQDVWREGSAKPIVTGHVEMVCVDKNNRVVPVPEVIAGPLSKLYGNSANSAT